MSDFVDITIKAGGDLSAKQYHFVKLDSSQQVIICAAATDKAIGIVQNKPESGEAARVRIFGRSKVSGNGALSIGDVIGTSSDGQAQAAVATNYQKGIVTKAVSNAGEIAECLLIPMPIVA